MHISLPELLKQFVEEQVASGRYSDTTEYILDLIRKDEKRQIEASLETRLLAGLHSGDRTSVTPQFWEDRRNVLLRRHANRTINGDPDQ